MSQRRKFSDACGLAVLVAGLGLAACAPTKQTEIEGPVLSGFLPKPELLQPGRSDQPGLVYLKPDTDWSTYSKVLIEPILFLVDRKDGGDDIDDLPPEQRQVLASAMYKYIYDAAAQHCEMVDVPSPGTFVLRFALVEADASVPTLNTVSSYVPQVNMVTQLSAYAFNDGVGFFVGGATAEGYAIDGGNGELLWEGVDKRVGVQAIGTDTVSSWAAVDKVFQAWAENVSTKIVELGICSKPASSAEGIHPTG